MTDKNEIEIKSTREWSNETTIPKPWQWFLHGIFMPISMLLTWIGGTIMILGNLFMFDTHHLEINLKPKK